VPEGIVELANGEILVAEQGRNRIVAIDPVSRGVRQWRAFANRTGQEGIDGIGPELLSIAAAPGGVIVPDSPNGLVWRVSLDGKTATQIGSGMTRPVGSAVDQNGRIFVADEGGSVWTLDPARRRFATLPTPDDVVVGRAGQIFVNTLGDNAIHEFDAQGHQLSMMSGINQPQGIALDGADNPLPRTRKYPDRRLRQRGDPANFRRRSFSAGAEHGCHPRRRVGRLDARRPLGIRRADRRRGRNQKYADPDGGWLRHLLWDELPANQSRRR